MMHACKRIFFIASLGLLISSGLTGAALAESEPGRLVGNNSPQSDGFETALDGLPGAIGTGRSSAHSYKENKSAGIINSDGFSLQLVKPQTHGRDEDVGARAGWSWEF